jgi:hypothetical protein
LGEIFSIIIKEVMADDFSTPLEQLPEHPQQAPAPRSQGVQQMGPADMHHEMNGGGYYEEDDYEEEFAVIEEDWMSYLKREGKVPLIAGIIFVLLHLDFVDLNIMKYLPQLFNKSCELTIQGIFFKGALLTVAVLVAKHFLL